MLVGCSIIKRSFLSVLIVFISNVSLAGSWEDIANGKHDFLELGEDFSITLPMEKIEKGAKLVLFNYRLAKEIGLVVPNDWAALERLVLEKFAYKVSENNFAEKKWMATYYNDGDYDNIMQGENGARGDGRAVWTGQVKFKDSEGIDKKWDLMVKGVGVTSLGYKKLEGHTDGLLDLSKAIQSFIQSEISQQNYIKGTTDLAVIELPYFKTDIDTGVKVKAALSVRVGNQTRPAHFRRHRDNRINFIRLLRFVAKRDFNLENKNINLLAKKYLERYQKAVATQSARFVDLNLIHLSPTPGNRTSDGGNIDIDSVRFFDAGHSDFRYNEWYIWDFDTESFANNGSGLRLIEQTKVMEKFVIDMISYFKQADIKISKAFTSGVMEAFDKNFTTALTSLWLHRIGLSVEDIQRLPDNVKRSFYRVTQKLYWQKGLKKFDSQGRQFYQAAYNMRGLFLKTPGIIKNQKKVFGEEWLRGILYEKGSFDKLKVQTRKDILDYTRIVNSFKNHLKAPVNWKKITLKAQKRNEKNRSGARPKFADTKVAAKKLGAPILKTYLSRPSKKWRGSYEDLNKFSNESIESMVDGSGVSPMLLRKSAVKRLFCRNILN